MSGDDITITEPGYVYIYLSNENPTPVEVYFDDSEVIHTKSPVIQTNEYYPFGLTYHSYLREDGVVNKYRFQGQEHIDALGLGWDSFKWRNHQPDIGRFFNVDPLADKFYYNSPYAFSENKVTNHVELEGLESVPASLRNEIKNVEVALDNLVYDVKSKTSSAASNAWNVIERFKDDAKDVIQKAIESIYSMIKRVPTVEYAPKPDPKADNYDMPKSLLDALTAISEATTAPSSTDIGSRS